MCVSKRKRTEFGRTGRILPIDAGFAHQYNDKRGKITRIYHTETNLLGLIELIGNTFLFLISSSSFL